ncbi:hypothetical protein, partial [Fructobacillus evanidus]|uniref:hypothetical protein n=1 Tax=Fructobacillus evanidus TaxID=3064281 RepID=UPI0030C7C9EE
IAQRISPHGLSSNYHCKEFFGFFVFQLSFELIIESAFIKKCYITVLLNENIEFFHETSYNRIVCVTL